MNYRSTMKEKRKDSAGSDDTASMIKGCTMNKLSWHTDSKNLVVLGIFRFLHHRKGKINGDQEGCRLGLKEGWYWRGRDWFRS